MYKIILSILIFGTLTGCAVNKEWGTSGGSKSDGIVELSYTYGAFEKPDVDNKEGLKKAIKTCQVWGYDSAESFDFINTSCQSMDFSGSCHRVLVTKKFQCIN